MNTLNKPRKSRLRVERAIYISPVTSIQNRKYEVISYSKEAKGTRTLATFINLEDARAYRDSNLRFARYGKGIMARKVKNGYKFDADVCLHARNKTVTFYIGAYSTPEQARAARLQFIENLK